MAPVEVLHDDDCGRKAARQAREDSGDGVQAAGGGGNRNEVEAVDRAIPGN
jgi:hypothetical protein